MQQDDDGVGADHRSETLMVMREGKSTAVQELATDNGAVISMSVREVSSHMDQHVEVSNAMKVEEGQRQQAI